MAGKWSRQDKIITAIFALYTFIGLSAMAVIIWAAVAYLASR